MEKNQFLKINDLIYDIYTWQTIDDIRPLFFQRLKSIIPFEYASLFFIDDFYQESYGLGDPICFPEFFKEAEKEYPKYADEDELSWIVHSTESKLLRESDVLDEQTRLNSSLYKECYKDFDIYDTLQYTLYYQQKVFGILTLFRTSAQGAFDTENMFYLRNIGMHLNKICYQLCYPEAKSSISTSLNFSDYALTSREKEIIQRLIQFEDNEEIANALDIRENTLHKHLQNIFRKCDVQSKWELLRKLTQD